MVAEVAGGILTSAVAGEIIERIVNFLRKKAVSREDRENLRKDITELVNLSNNTGCAIGRFVHLLKSSTEASVHCTELRRVLKAIRRKDGAAQLTELMEIRVKKYLRKEGVGGIYQYREDYEQAKQHYDEAERHLNMVINDFEAGKESYAQEMEHLNRELDEMVIMAERRISELIEALREAYKVLERIN